MLNKKNNMLIRYKTHTICYDKRTNMTMINLTYSFQNNLAKKFLSRIDLCDLTCRSTYSYQTLMNDNVE